MDSRLSVTRFCPPRDGRLDETKTWAASRPSYLSFQERGNTVTSFWPPGAAACSRKLRKGLASALLSSISSRVQSHLSNEVPLYSLPSIMLSLSLSFLDLKGWKRETNNLFFRLEPRATKRRVRGGKVVFSDVAFFLLLFLGE